MLGAEGAVRAVRDVPHALQPLLVFAALNFVLMGVEVSYGAMAGSLGLVCDGVHLAINCFGVGLSLVALEVSKRGPSLASGYGFERVHVLAAFTNTVSIIFVAMFLVVEALHRFGEEHAEHDHGSHVLAVASAGLVVDIVGLGLLRQSSERIRLSTRGKTTSAHRSSAYTPSNSQESMRYAQVLNLQAVLLHASCDILSSVGVILSSLLSKHQGWTSADPLFAIVIAFLIVWSVSPLMFSSGQTLLQAAPLSGLVSMDKALREIQTVPGVLESRHEHLFMYSPNTIVVTFHVRIRDQANEAELLPRICSIVAGFSQHATVQLTKDHV